MATSTSPLDDLRRRIDEIDDQLHDLLIKRAEVVEAVAAYKRTGDATVVRPGREARILRRLVARHRGRFPRANLVRIWRELISGSTAMQADFSVAVFAPDEAPGYWDLARDHFGSHTQMAAYRSSGEVLRAVTEGRSTLGVLAMPQEGDRSPWWRLLAGTDAAAPRVIARLPFAGRGNARSGGDAFVIGGGDLEPTGADNSLVIIETSIDVSRARLIAALTGAGFAMTLVAVIEPGADTAWNLVELDDLVMSSDARLAKALEPLGDKVGRVSALGSYARPFQPAELAEQDKVGLEKVDKVGEEREERE